MVTAASALEIKVEQNNEKSSLSESTPSTSNAEIKEISDQASEHSDHTEKVEEKSEGVEGEEGECGFCLFMKGGGCKDSFTAWEVCVEEGERNKEDIVEKCSEITSLLKKCMDEHADYYAPILRAEKAMEEEVNNQLDQEKAEETQLERKAELEQEKEKQQEN
ncbi:hypothetical protein C5167_022654 [Papaver somniferum]|uniref:GCK domain-containing protein n=1 Tax=Papaver somniferum TaxID=3469 RepID=A0A4Y7JJH0_PAPSO|nr:uncharacterized protein LOC113281727 [Papaver somniferum]RZC60897.1 hypothetical protein C5167_022654 [Papaver somniferum]